MAKKALSSLGIISYLGLPREASALTKKEPMPPLQPPVPKRMGGLANKIRNIAGVMVSPPHLLCLENFRVITSISWKGRATERPNARAVGSG